MHKKELLIKQVQIYKSLTVTNIYEKSSTAVTGKIGENHCKEEFCCQILLRQNRPYHPRSCTPKRKHQVISNNTIWGKFKNWRKKIFSSLTKMNRYMDIFIQIVSILSDTEKIVSGIYGIIDSLFHNS